MPPQGPDSETCRFFKKAAILQKLGVFTNVNIGGMVVPPMYGVRGDSLRCPPLRHPLAYGGRKSARSSLHMMYPIFFVSRKRLVISIEISKG